MFHIPFDKRQNTANQRYSLSGYPCLYLGSSLYDCWEELHRPSFDNINMASIKAIENLNVIDMRLPKKMKSIDDFVKFLFVLVCSSKVHNYEAPFKPEYIFPQAVLHSVIRINKTFKLNKSNLIDGIKYTSTYYDRQNALFSEENLFFNIVIPVVSSRSSDNDLCEYLCKKFVLTMPISIQSERITNTNQEFLCTDSELNNEIEKYKLTEFGRLETKLKKVNFIN